MEECNWKNNILFNSNVFLVKIIQFFEKEYKQVLMWVQNFF